MKTVIKLVGIVLVIVILGSVILSLAGGIELKTVISWLDEETASDISRMEIFNYNYGVMPNSEVICYYTTDKEIIAEALAHYGSTKISPVLDITDMGLYFGGFSKNVVFTYENGSTSDIDISNGYFVAGLFLMNMNETNGFTGEGMNRFYRFMANDDSYKIYEISDSANPVKEVESGASNLGFEIYSGEANKADATHIIEASFGSIYVISDTVCYLDIKHDSLGSGDGYYTLYNASFYQLIK